MVAGWGAPRQGCGACTQGSLLQLRHPLGALRAADICSGNSEAGGPRPSFEGASGQHGTSAGYLKKTHLTVVSKKGVREEEKVLKTKPSTVGRLRDSRNEVIRVRVEREEKLRSEFVIAILKK